MRRGLVPATLNGGRKRPSPSWGTTARSMSGCFGNTGYLNGPRSSPPPDIEHPRITIRYVNAWLQHTHGDKYGCWSWHDQRATPSYYKARVEALTITDGYPGVDAPGKDLDNWLAADAGGKNYGETYRSQWEVAKKCKPLFLFINQWNEFCSPSDQYNVNLSPRCPTIREPVLVGPPDFTMP